MSLGSKTPPTTTDAKTGSLARELAAAYPWRLFTGTICISLALKPMPVPADATIRCRKPPRTGHASWTSHPIRSPGSTSIAWSNATLTTLSPSGPTSGAKQRELASGHRTAAALDWHGRPWQRAHFLAIRDSFRADNPPRTGIKAALLDTAAEAFGDYPE